MALVSNAEVDLVAAAGSAMIFAMLAITFVVGRPGLGSRQVSLRS